MRRGTILTLTMLLLAALAIAGCGGGDDSSSSSTTDGTTATEKSEAPGADTSTKPKVTVPDGPPPKQLEKRELVEGTGTEAKPGDEVSVQYVGVGYESGEQFDASWDRGEPFTFKLGAGEVITGWDKGVAGMKVGGRRELIVPPGQAYGPNGYPPAIGPNETLIFVVDLVAAG